MISGASDIRHLLRRTVRNRKSATGEIVTASKAPVSYNHARGRSSNHFEGSIQERCLRGASTDACDTVITRTYRRTQGSRGKPANAKNGGASRAHDSIMRAVACICTNPDVLFRALEACTCEALAIQDVGLTRGGPGIDCDRIPYRSEFSSLASSVITARARAAREQTQTRTDVLAEYARFVGTRNIWTRTLHAEITTFVSRVHTVLAADLHALSHIPKVAEHHIVSARSFLTHVADETGVLDEAEGHLRTAETHVKSGCEHAVFETEDIVQRFGIAVYVSAHQALATLNASLRECGSDILLPHELIFAVSQACDHFSKRITLSNAKGMEDLNLDISVLRDVTNRVIPGIITECAVVSKRNPSATRRARLEHETVRVRRMPATPDTLATLALLEAERRKEATGTSNGAGVGAGFGADTGTASGTAAKDAAACRDDGSGSIAVICRAEALRIAALGASDTLSACKDSGVSIMRLRDVHDRIIKHSHKQDLSQKLSWWKGVVQRKVHAVLRAIRTDIDNEVRGALSARDDVLAWTLPIASLAAAEKVMRAGTSAPSSGTVPPCALGLGETGIGIEGDTVVAISRCIRDVQHAVEELVACDCALAVRSVTVVAKRSLGVIAATVTSRHERRHP